MQKPVENKSYKAVAMVIEMDLDGESVRMGLGNAPGCARVASTRAVSCHNTMTLGDCGMCKEVRCRRAQAQDKAMAAHALPQPDDVCTGFLASPEMDMCKRISEDWEAKMDYLVTPSPLPTHRSWGKLGQLLEKLHSSVAVPYVTALRAAMRLASPVPMLGSDEFRSQMLENANTPAKMAERLVLPGGWLLGQHIGLDPGLEAMRNAETSGVTVVQVTDPELVLRLEEAQREAKELREKVTEMDTERAMEATARQQTAREFELAKEVIEKLAKPAMQTVVPRNLAVPGALALALARPDEGQRVTEQMLAAFDKKVLGECSRYQAAPSDVHQTLTAVLQSAKARAIADLSVPLNGDTSTSAVAAAAAQRVCAAARSVQETRAPLRERLRTVLQEVIDSSGAGLAPGISMSAAVLLANLGGAPDLMSAAMPVASVSASALTAVPRPASRETPVSLESAAPAAPAAAPIAPPPVAPHQPRTNLVRQRQASSDEQPEAAETVAGDEEASRAADVSQRGRKRIRTAKAQAQ